MASTSTACSTAATSVTVRSEPSTTPPLSRRFGPTMKQTSLSSVREFLIDLQDRITSTVAMVDGGSFVVDRWTKPPAEVLQEVAEGQCRHQVATS